jgi:hypothetical protein
MPKPIDFKVHQLKEQKEVSSDAFGSENRLIRPLRPGARIAFLDVAKTEAGHYVENYFDVYTGQVCTEAESKVHLNVIDMVDKKRKVLAMSAYQYDRLKELVRKLRVLRVYGPLYPPKVKARSKRGWHTPKT